MDIVHLKNAENYLNLWVWSCYVVFTIWNWENHKTSGKYADFESNSVHLLKILLNNPKKFIKQKVPRIIFYPWKHPSQSQKLKNELKGNFFWDTLYFYNISNK